MAGTGSTLSSQATGSTPRRSNETIPNFSRPHTPRSQTAPPEPQDLYLSAEATTSTAGIDIDEGEPVRLEIAPVILAAPLPVNEHERIATTEPIIIPGLAMADPADQSLIITGLAIAEPPAVAAGLPGIATTDPEPGIVEDDTDTPLPSRPSITQRPPTAASSHSSTSPPHTRRARIAIVDAPPPPTRGGADSKSIRSQIAPSICSPEDEVLSLKVRSLYDSGVGGSDAGSQFSKRVSSIMEEGGKRMSRVSRNSFVGSGDERFAEEDENEDLEGQRIKDELEAAAIEEENAAEEKREIERSIHLRAGGAEDWEDLNGSDVDRFVAHHPTTPPPFFVYLDIP